MPLYNRNLIQSPIANGNVSSKNKNYLVFGQFESNTGK